jgi:hypothetical protein
MELDDTLQYRLKYESNNTDFTIGILKELSVMNTFIVNIRNFTEAFSSKTDFLTSQMESVKLREISAHISSLPLA